MSVPFHLLALSASVAGTPASLENVDAVAIFLLFLILLITGVAVVFVVLARRQVRANRQFALLLRAQAGLASTNGSPVPRSIFDLPQRWLAIRSSNLTAVREALCLRNVHDCTWEEGLAEARERKLFLSPPIGEWILVMGSDLPDPSDDPDRCFHFLSRLSRELGQVQFFSANRVVYHHAWIRLLDGRVLRAYAWAGETLWNQGSLTGPEIELDLQCLDYGETAEDSGFGDHAQRNVDRVPLLAARWSFDPGAIDTRLLRAHRGLSGEASLNHLV